MTDAPLRPGSVAVRPEDMLEDDQDARTINGVLVRKGTLGAFIMNVKNLEQYPDGTAERAELLDALRSLAPAVRALGLLEMFEPRSPVVRAVLESSEEA